MSGTPLTLRQILPMIIVAATTVLALLIAAPPSQAAATGNAGPTATATQPPSCSTGSPSLYGGKWYCPVT